MPIEKIIAKVFSTRNLIILTVIVVLGIAGVIIVSNPQLLKR